MKQKLIGLSQRYVAALRKHLDDGRRVILKSALELGREAVALGLETLALVRIHEQALIQLKISNHQDALLKRAQIFFAEASIPTEEAHRAARQGEIDLRRLNAALSRRTMELAVTNRQLQRGVIRRKIMEDAFKKSGRHHTKCLGEALQLQKHLRQLTHRMLAAQEDERTRLSHNLQNDIAQTLLGINIRLVSLKRDARSNAKGLKKDIAKAQQLVVKSAQTVRRFARQLETTQAGAE